MRPCISVRLPIAADTKRRSTIRLNDLRSVVVAIGHILHVAGRPDIVDSAGPRIVSAEYRRAFPGLVIMAQAVDTDSDRVTVRWSLRGASLGAFAGLTPTGQTHEGICNFVFRFAGDQVTESRVLAQAAALPRQAGMDPLSAERPGGRLRRIATSRRDSIPPIRGSARRCPRRTTSGQRPQRCRPVARRCRRP